MTETTREHQGPARHKDIRADLAYAAHLAWRIDSVNSGTIIPLGTGLKTHLQHAINSDPRLSMSGGVIDGKTQPSFKESLEATDRRLRFLGSFLPELPESVLGVISGGSMSYGRFYNVREGYPDSSDLDLIFVTDGPISIDDIEQIARTDLGFKKDEQDLFRKRVPVFEDGFTRGNMDVLSHKFTLPDQEFDVSTHFIPRDVMARFMDSDLKADLARGDDVDIRLRDYKPGSFPHRTNYQRDFEGNVYPLQVAETGTTHGTVSMIPAYAIFNDQLVPGMYHNLCSPMFEVALDRDGVTQMMTEFESVMYETRDQVVRNKPEAALSKSHIRHGVLSPHIINEIDQK